MGWLIDCKRSCSLLPSKTAATAPRGRVAAGTGRGFCARSDHGAAPPPPSAAITPEPPHHFWFEAASLDAGPKRAGWDVPAPSPGGQGSPRSSFTGWARVSCPLSRPPPAPSPARVCRGHGDCWEPPCTCSPLQDTCREALGLSPGKWGLSDGHGPFFPAGISGSRLPRSFPVALRSLPRWQGTPRDGQSGGGAAGKPACPRSAGVRWENILHGSVAHATWSLAAENRVGRNKAEIHSVSN